MKLGINHKTGQNWSLASWFTASMVTPVAFTLEWIPNECQMVKRQGVKFWTSGVLNYSTFKNLKILPFGEMADYNFTQVSYIDKEYLTFKIVPNGPPFPGLVNETTSLSLGYDGIIAGQKSSGMLVRYTSVMETTQILVIRDGKGQSAGARVRSSKTKKFFMTLLFLILLTTMKV
ncbi:hypothetical protein Q3G72_033513 [Acer saccharum]|nr:hypothetical protein Q3G72_033513 [Acer saccharum]